MDKVASEHAPPPVCNTGFTMNKAETWPALPREAWQPTGDTLHLWLQIAGKVKLALCPWLNEWWQTGLHVTARGITTGNIPLAEGVFQIDFNFIEHVLQIQTSAGEYRAITLRPRSVADFFQDFMEALSSLAIDLPHFRPVPDEIAAPIPFAEDHVHDAYDAGLVRRWWRILLNVSKILEAHRSTFTGKSSPVLFWWGGFDLNQSRFSGRPAAPPAGANRIMRFAEDQESVAAGFWPGTAELGDFTFYSYTYPEPPGFKEAAIRPAQASYDATFGEFLLRYEDVRRSADPAATIEAFLQSTYEAGADLGGWDRQRLERPLPAFLTWQNRQGPA
jgi:hypothetical protein